MAIQLSKVGRIDIDNINVGSIDIGSIDLASTSLVPRASILRQTPSKPLLARLLLALLLLCGASGMVHAQDASGICRVSTTGTSSNDGASWAEARSIMSALNDFQCTEIWVAEGVYAADAYPFSFSIRPNVQVYGGFAGNEANRSQRDWVAHVTVLTGDKDHNDSNDDNNFIAEDIDDIVGNNSRQVLKLNGPITSAVVIDGFTITAGDGRPINGFGGGLYCFGSNAGNQCSPVLSHLIFSGNTAALGGAVWLGGAAGGNSSPQISHVTFIGNEASTSGSGQTFGGALFCNGATGGVCNPSLSHVTFRDNYAGYYGGGMYNDGHSGGTSNPSLTNVTFDNNSAFYQGGAMLNFGLGGESSPSLLNVTFSNNSAINGGAMFNQGQMDADNQPGEASPLLRNVTFSNNHANSSGGGMYNWGAFNGNSSPTLINVTFSGNSAGSQGGAIYSTARGSGNTSPTLTNVILWDNTAGNSGAAIHIDDEEFATTNLSLDYCVVEGGDSAITYETGATSTAFTSGTWNFNGNPELTALGNHGGFTQTMVPGFNGPAVDTGTCTNVPPVDQRGVARAVGVGCDIGSVEAQSDVIFASSFE